MPAIGGVGIWRNRTWPGFGRPGGSGDGDSRIRRSREFSAFGALSAAPLVGRRSAPAFATRWNAP